MIKKLISKAISRDDDYLFMNVQPTTWQSSPAIVNRTCIFVFHNSVGPGHISNVFMSWSLTTANVSGRVQSGPPTILTACLDFTNIYTYITLTVTGAAVPTLSYTEHNTKWWHFQQFNQCCWAPTSHSSSINLVPDVSSHVKLLSNTVYELLEKHSSKLSWLV